MGVCTNTMITPNAIGGQNQTTEVDQRLPFSKLLQHVEDIEGVAPQGRLV